MDSFPLPFPLAYLHCHQSLLPLPLLPTPGHYRNMSLAWTERHLYGGAITCEIPSDWRDVSDIRQVPDHQECWQEADGAVLVVEILERRQNVSDADGAAFFFNDLAQANGASTPQDARFQPATLTLPNLPENSTLCSGIGYQRVALGREVDIAGNRRAQEVRWIKVDLAAFRLQRFNTELLVTMSIPISDPNGPPAPGNNSSFDEQFQHIMSTLTVRDWELFVG